MTTPSPTTGATSPLPPAPAPAHAPRLPTRAPRLVATDLDGTLLRSDGTVSPHTAEVLREVLDRGVEVAFVTARPWRWMTELWAYVGSRGLAVVSNGALLLDVATGEPLEVHGIERDVGLPLVEAIRSRVPGSAFAIEMLAGISLDPDYREPGHAPPGSPRGDLAELWTGPVLKLLVRQADVLAIGDGRNDIEMLRWAGRGVAMGQAIELVREAADAVTDTVYDEGAATELDRWFPAEAPGRASTQGRPGHGS